VILVAQVGAEGVERDPVALERGAKTRKRHAVLLGDALHRAINLHIVHAYSRVARELHLRLVEDQALEQLALEHVARRRLRPLPAQLALGGADRLVQFRERDHFLVDDRDDAIDQVDALGERVRGKKSAARTGSNDQRKQGPKRADRGTHQ